MIFHPHLLWVSLFWFIWFPEAEWGSKTSSCFCSGGFGKRVPVGPGCWETGVMLPQGCSAPAQGAQRVPPAPPGTGGSDFPSHPPRLNIISLK